MLWLLAHPYIFIIKYHRQCFTLHTASVIYLPVRLFSHTLFALLVFFWLVNKRHPIFGCHLSSVFYLYWFTKGEKKLLWTLYASRFLLSICHCCLSHEPYIQCTGFVSTLLWCPALSRCFISLPSYCVVCLFIYVLVWVCLSLSLCIFSGSAAFWNSKQIAL